MPQCAKLRRRPSATWVSLRSRSLSVCLRSRTVKRVAQAPLTPKRPRPRRPRKRNKRLPTVDPAEEQGFLYGHAFDVLLALGLVPTKDRIKQEDDLELSLNRMHVMEGECDKTAEMVAESAPDLATTNTVIADIKLGKEDVTVTKQELEVSELPEQAVKSTSPPLQLKRESEPLVNGDAKEGGNKEEDIKCEKSESVSAVKSENVCVVENGKDGNCESSAELKTDRKRNGGEEKEDRDAKVSGKEAEAKEVVSGSGTNSGAVSEEEDRNSVTSSQSRKRVAALTEAEGEGESSSCESDVGSKRARLENDDGEDERERLVRECVDECTETMEDMSRAAEKLQREIGALGELLRSKELEWNSILRLRKLKEEMLERLLRRRRQAAIGAESVNVSATVNGVKEESCGEREKNLNKPSKVINFNSLPNNLTNLAVATGHPNNSGLMMVPIVSSSPSPSPSPGLLTNCMTRGPGYGPTSRMPVRLQRPILPKPGPQHQQLHDQNSIVGEGRSRHPDVPRRGRRMRPHEGGPPRGMMEQQGPMVSSTRISGSPALMSMANMALGSGSHVRENPPFMGQDNSRPSSADNSRGHHMEMLPAPGLSFKDALVQFAKMSQPPKPPPPPPPYPEVTLHPVSPPPPNHTSLLHGILTKSGPPNMPPQGLGPQAHRATTFSPTLARLLTAPERGPAHAPHNPGHNNFRPPPHARVNMAEILSSSKKNRNEITITPVSGSNKTKDDVVMLADEDEEGDGDRLVIDESRDNATNSELPENVPECQGCHQRTAQFVCAGCGNQWYCSRECQVSAWEDHSEMCSG